MKKSFLIILIFIVIGSIFIRNNYIYGSVDKDKNLIKNFKITSHSQPSENVWSAKKILKKTRIPNINIGIENSNITDQADNSIDQIISDNLYDEDQVNSNNTAPTRTISDRGAMRSVINNKSNDLILGIDISHYQSDSKQIEWYMVAESNIEFAFVKISEGNTYKDPFSREHINGARSVNIPVGGYHFARPSQPLIVDAHQEALHFAQQLKKVSNDYGALPAVLDLEVPYSPSESGLSTVDLLNWANAFCVEFKKITDHPIIIYTGNWFIETWDNFDAPNNTLLNYELWVADYYSDRIPAGGWTEYLIWQFTDKGSVDGIYGDVDLNMANKDLLTYTK